MTSIRRFNCLDLFSISSINLDSLTETYQTSYYQSYMSEFPQLFTCAESISNSTESISAYCMNKIENDYNSLKYKSHISALSVSSTHRRIGIADSLMKQLEIISENTFNTRFIDLYVRASNKLAIKMYEKFGYIVYRRILNYYSNAALLQYQLKQQQFTNNNPMNILKGNVKSLVQSDEDGLDMRKSLKRDQDKLAMIPLQYPVTADQAD